MLSRANQAVAGMAIFCLVGLLSIGCNSGSFDSGGKHPDSSAKGDNGIDAVRAIETRSQTPSATSSALTSNISPGTGTSTVHSTQTGVASRTDQGTDTATDTGPVTKTGSTTNTGSGTGSGAATRTGTDAGVGSNTGTSNSTGTRSSNTTTTGNSTGTGLARLDGGIDASRDASAVSRDGGPNLGTDASYPPPSGKPTVYLAGDSTVQTYSASQAPQQGWGQRIAEFFTTDVLFVNRAMGGRSSKSFIDEGRLKEILGVIKAGDYLFAQWGINDRYKSDASRYTDPKTTFRSYLKQYIEGARKKNAIPVLVTPTPRLDYSNGVFQNDFSEYCAAIKALGQETNTPVIDLQTMALAYYQSIGYTAVVNTIALPGPDVLHFRDTGAYQMARLVAQGVLDLGIPISKYVIPEKLRAK